MKVKAELLSQILGEILIKFIKYFVWPETFYIILFWQRTLQVAFICYNTNINLKNLDLKSFFVITFSSLFLHDSWKRQKSFSFHILYVNDLFTS